VFTARYVPHSTFCPHSVFMCFVWIWEQTAIISLYSINWLVFITETECVYCAVRFTFYVLPTQCIYVFCVDLRTNSDYFTVQQWLVGFYNWDGVCLLRGTFYIPRSPHTMYLCVLCGSENKPIISLYNINWLVFINEMECVYCAVRTESLYIIWVNVLKCSMCSAVGVRNRPWFRSDDVQGVSFRWCSSDRTVQVAERSWTQRQHTLFTDFHAWDISN